MRVNVNGEKNVYIFLYEWLGKLKCSEVELVVVSSALPLVLPSPHYSRARHLRSMLAGQFSNLFCSNKNDTLSTLNGNPPRYRRRCRLLLVRPSWRIPIKPTVLMSLYLRARVPFSLACGFSSLSFAYSSRGCLECWCARKIDFLVSFSF